MKQKTWGLFERQIVQYVPIGMAGREKKVRSAL
jgi:hypothetical protein